MRTYDITLTITPELVVWPDDPQVEVYQTDKISEGSVVNVSRIHMGVHTGTHIDAPYHFIDEGGTVEDIPIGVLTGRAYVLHVEDDVDLITKELVENSSIPPRTKRVLFRMGSSPFVINKC